MTVRIHVADDVDLEARWDGADDPVAVVVLCHPHPLHGGSMTVPLITTVAKLLAERGLAVLRFNFRGVGGSTGSHDGGGGERDDVAAAVDTAAGRFPHLLLGVAGWSFGAATSLRWMARDGLPLPWVGIAPPIRSSLTPTLPTREELPRAPRTFVVGDRDQFVTVDEMEAYAASVDGRVSVLRGSDHFFHFREDRVAALVATGLPPLVGDPYRDDDVTDD